MKISIVGTGYVGLVTGVCFAEVGNHVWCVDSDTAKIDGLKNGVIPIYEPGLEEMAKRNQSNGSITFTTDIADTVRNTNLCFIAVGTPMGADGSADLRQVMAVAREIGRLIEHDMIIVNKSTVPVGTAAVVYGIVDEEMRRRRVSHAVRVVSNPEFLKEGTAINDCMSPDRVVIGAPCEESAEVMKELYAPFVRTSERFILMDVASAEMTKYAANAMLATRISFMNEIACLCEAVGADVNKVRLGIGSDGRIGYKFLFAGCGYGGSCFPKDVQALIKTAKDHGCSASILEQVEAVNHRQKQLLVDKVTRRFGDVLSGKKIAIWGLAFKPNTDDVREAPALHIIRQLVAKGAEIAVYDPVATEEAKLHLKDLPVTYEKSKYTPLAGADAMLLVTEWKEFRSPDFDEMKARMKTPVIFDGRNQYIAETLKRQGFEYYQIGTGIS